MRRIAVAAWAAALLALGSFAAEDNVFYADATFGNDDWDGTVAQHIPDTDHGPTKSLQAAINLVPNSAVYKIYAATGVYDRVETWAGNCSNRLNIADKRIGVIATGRREDTIIKGAADGNYANGCGPAAVRCVYIAGSADGSYVRGFTLSDGHTGLANGSNNAYGSGACISGGTSGKAVAVDCVLTNSYVGYRGAAYAATLIRCVVFSPVKGDYGMLSSKAFNCLVYAEGFGAGPYVNCSFMTGGAQGASSADSHLAKFYNCYCRNPKKWPLRGFVKNAS